jgi:hypothetical protein
LNKKLSRKKLGMLTHACHPSDSMQLKIGLQSPAWLKIETLFPKITSAKRFGGMA